MNEIKNKVEQNEVQGTRAERALLESQLSVWQLDVCFVFFFFSSFFDLTNASWYSWKRAFSRPPVTITIY